MLSNIKVKFLNVSKNVKFLQTEKTKEESQVNFDAGSEILEYFKKEWETLHELNECNAEKASEVAQQIEKTYTHITKQKKEINEVTDIFVNSNLISNIDSACKQIAELYTICDTVENDLIQLENTIDQIEFEKLKSQHEFHLKKYEEKKEENLKTLEHDLKEKRKQKLIEEEKEKCKKMEERQRVFQEAFRNDLELFKTLGQIPKVEIIRKQPSALLEEIQLDYDEKELDQFFEDDN